VIGRIASLARRVFERVPAQGYFLGKIIPYPGSWVEFEYDTRTCSMSAATASASSMARCFCAPGPGHRRRHSEDLYRIDKIAIKRQKSCSAGFRRITGV